jgi:hypothetical protein
MRSLLVGGLHMDQILKKRAVRKPRHFRFFPLGSLSSFVSRAIAARGAAARRTRCGERLCPDPATTPEPVIQVYAARALGWRGYFGVHTWIAVKRTDERAFTVYEVTYWDLRRHGSAVAIQKRIPDEPWYGNPAELLAERRGEGADALIERIDRAAREYPYASRYVVWPGPNSNTFVAHIARTVLELELDFPPTAIGKDYFGYRLLGTAPSGSGVQVSFLGLFSVLISRVEGFEINFLGLTFGFDPFTIALKLPMFGRFGIPRVIGRRSADEQAAQQLADQ